MKLILIILIVPVLMISCIQNNSKTNKMEEAARKPISTIEDAKTFVANNFNEHNESLWISETLLDPIGMNMAIIVDGILNLGYIPDGFEQKDGYRIYKYKK